MLKHHTLAEKKEIPWFVYKDGSSFKDIESVKEFISSISVFGNPPKSFIDECHQNNIKVYLAVGGNEENIDTPEKIKVLVDKYVADCKANGYDGIDLDFKHLSCDIQHAYFGFLKLASQKLHAAGKKLSHCVSFYLALYQDNKTKMFHDPEALLELADELEIPKIGFWHFSSVDPQMWGVTEKWKRK